MVEKSTASHRSLRHHSSGCLGGGGGGGGSALSRSSHWWSFPARENLPHVVGTLWVGSDAQQLQRPQEESSAADVEVDQTLLTEKVQEPTARVVWRHVFHLIDRKKEIALACCGFVVSWLLSFHKLLVVV